MKYKQQIALYCPVNEQERMDQRNIYHYIEQYPHSILFRTNEIAHLTSSGFIMNQSLTKVLVIYHKIYNAWGWTGGHADGDDNLLEIALKEAREETGLKKLTPLSRKMMSIDILPVWGHMKHKGYVGAHLHLNAAYVLIADECDALVVNQVETGGCKWIDVDSIDAVCQEPDLVVVYKKLIESARQCVVDKKIKEIGKGLAGKDHEETIVSLIKRSVTPIVVLEAKSAYYKLKLTKDLLSKIGKEFHRLWK